MELREIVKTVQNQALKKGSFFSKVAKSEEGVRIVGFAELPEKALLDAKALAEALQVSTRTIRRMVARFELPPPVRMRGRAFWFAGKVLAYLEAQADRLQRTAEREAKKIRELA